MEVLHKEMIKCEKCDREFLEGPPYPGKLHTYKGQVICEDCLVAMGVPLDETHSYEEYIRTQTDINRA